MARPHRAFRRELLPWDKDFICLHLDEAGRFLFFQMDIVDQRHALSVAKNLLAKRGYQTGVPTHPLVEVALLHDTGKIAGDFTIFSRLIVGLLKRIAPNLRKKWADRCGNAVARACYSDLVHAARGAYMARAFGIAKETVELISAHHDPPQPGEPSLLTYLREADHRSLLELR